MNNDNQNQQSGITRKIKEGATYYIWRKDINGYSFYSIQLKQKLINGNEFKYYQKVSFRKGVDIPNGTPIVILRGIENDEPNPKDEYGFIRKYMILDYEIVTDAIKEYNNKKENENVNEDVLGEEIQITPDDLPF